MLHHPLHQSGMINDIWLGISAEGDKLAETVVHPTFLVLLPSKVSD